MILYDILRNAQQVKLEGISKRQGALAMLQGEGKDGNDFDLLNMDYDKMPEWKRQPAKDRAELLFRDFPTESRINLATSRLHPVVRPGGVMEQTSPLRGGETLDGYPFARQDNRTVPTAYAIAPCP